MIHDDEPLTRLLRRLPQAGPDPARAARVQARCHKVLARRAKPSVTVHPRPLESALFAALGVAYLLSVLQYALQ